MFEMTRERLLEILEELCQLDGVSGYEQPVVRHLKERLTGLADQVEIDPMGNLFALRRGQQPGPTLMISAHTDEIGAAVRAVEPNGFLRITLLGGTLPALLAGRMVTVKGHPGVVGVRPGHLQSPEERRRTPSEADLYVDLGVTSAEEVSALGIEVGDPVCYHSPLRRLGGSRVAGKALDNRAGCAVLVALLEEISGQPPAGTLWAVFNVQEEVGLRGARVAAHRVRPDYAVVIDTIPAGDTPDVATTREHPVYLGRGPAFAVISGPRGRGNIMQPAMRKMLVEAASRAQVPYQLVTFTAGTSDISAVAMVGDGIPAAVVNIPRRYAHSPVEVLDLEDLWGAYLVVREILRQNGERRAFSFLQE